MGAGMMSIQLSFSMNLFPAMSQKMRRTMWASVMSDKKSAVKQKKNTIFDIVLIIVL